MEVEQVEIIEQSSTAEDQQQQHDVAPDGAPGDAVAEAAASEPGDDQQRQLDADESGMDAQGRPDGAPTSSGADEPAAAADAPAPQVSAEALGRLRDAFVALNPEVVPELILGETVEAVLASLEAARAAYDRVKGAVEARAAGSVPRGGSSRTLDAAVLDSLSPEAKIAYGLQQHQA